MKKLIVLLIIVILGLAGFVGYQTWFGGDDAWFSRDVATTPEDTDEQGDMATTTDPMADEDDDNEPVRVIGTSVEGRDITAYSYGTGDTEILLVGGIHGGYSWNTTVLAREMMTYFMDEEDMLPENVTVTVIPVLNPDGLHETFGTTVDIDTTDAPEATIAGRFNANGVDLNRNFDCEWQTESMWQDQTVDAGDAPFSEPEAAALRAYVETNNPEAVVVYYAAAGGVYASNCRNGVLPETLAITNEYADASGYAAYESFDFYDITGDAVNWMAKEGIPAISVLLTTHTDIEWEKNRAGVDALIEYYAADDDMNTGDNDEA